MTLSMYHVGMFVGVMGLIIVPMWHLPVVRLGQVGWGEYAWIALGCCCALLASGMALRTPVTIGLLLVYYLPPIALHPGILGLLFAALTAPAASRRETRENDILSLGAVSLSGLCMLIGAASLGVP